MVFGVTNVFGVVCFEPIMFAFGSEANRVNKVFFVKFVGSNLLTHFERSANFFGTNLVTITNLYPNYIERKPFFKDFERSKEFKLLI